MTVGTIILQVDILFLGYKIKVVDLCFIMSTYIYHKSIRSLLIRCNRSLKILFLSIVKILGAHFADNCLRFKEIVNVE